MRGAISVAQSPGARRKDRFPSPSAPEHPLYFSGSWQGWRWGSPLPLLSLFKVQPARGQSGTARRIAFRMRALPPRGQLGAAVLQRRTHAQVKICPCQSQRPAIRGFVSDPGLEARRPAQTVKATPLTSRPARRLSKPGHERSWPNPFAMKSHPPSGAARFMRRTIPASGA